MVFDRRYVAVAWGHIEPPKGEIRSWLTDGEYCVLSSPTDNGGKLAVTHYEVRQASRRYSLVDLKLDTGRRNQIRVHLRELKHPVVHDPMYGYKDDISPVARLCLHAYRLCFTHPVTGKRMKYETPVPSAFMKLMEL
jgi:23S rRNA pseudouridine1911/1915/1917 synthase